MLGMCRFSIPTVFICGAVALVVLSYCKNIPVTVPEQRVHVPETLVYYTIPGRSYKPEPGEVVDRLLWAEPLAFIATLLAIKGVRKIWHSIPRDKNRDSSSAPPIG